MPTHNNYRVARIYWLTDNISVIILELKCCGKTSTCHYLGQFQADVWFKCLLNNKLTQIYIPVHVHVYYMCDTPGGYGVSLVLWDLVINRSSQYSSPFKLVISNVELGQLLFCFFPKISPHLPILIRSNCPRVLCISEFDPWDVMNSDSLATVDSTRLFSTSPNISMAVKFTILMQRYWHSLCRY